MNYYTFSNCIVYSNYCYNVAGTAIVTNEFAFGNLVTGTFQNCCIASTNKYGGASVTFNSCYTNNPGFVNSGVGYGTNLLNNPFNFQLAKGAFCIDKGTNETWMSTATDQTGANVIGNPRQNGNVDIGCYEYVSPPASGTSVFFR